MVLAAKLTLAAATTAYSIVAHASDCVLCAAIKVARPNNSEQAAGVAAGLPLGEHLGGRVDGLSLSVNWLLLLQFLHFENCRVILQIANLDKRLSSVLFAKACRFLGNFAS